MDTKSLTIKVVEAAKLLGISRSLAYELVREGKIPALRLGKKRWVIPRSAIDQMLNSSSW